MGLVVSQEPPSHCECWLADDGVGVGGVCAVGGVVLIVVVGGDGVGSIAGVAHCMCWLAMVVEGVSGVGGTGVVHSITRSSQKSLPTLLLYSIDLCHLDRSTIRIGHT